MKLLNLKLTGFIGIQKGMGVEEISLDLAKLHGLIALEGDNGMGKTTLLENLQPFRTLPSRKAKLKDHCFLKNSQKELMFIFDGCHYRTLVKMDPTTTIGDEGFIWKDGKPVVDGKVSNFDRYLVELLGSQNLFFNSIFCAQNSSKLSDLRPAELKGLFAEFLRLDRYVNWEETAKAAARSFDQAVISQESGIERLQTQITMLGDPRQDFKNATRVMATLEDELAATTQKLAKDAEDLETLKKIVMESHINQEKRIALDRERDRLQKSSTAMADEHDTTINDLKARVVAIETETELIEETLEDKAAIQRAVELVNEADEAIEQMEKEIEVNELESVDLNGQFLAALNKVDAKIAARDELMQDQSIKNEVIEMHQVGAGIDLLAKEADEIENHSELVRMLAQIAAMEKSAAVLGNIDPACTSEVCGLITQSLADKEALVPAWISYDDKKKSLTEAIKLKIASLETDVIKREERIKQMIDDKDRSKERLDFVIVDLKSAADIAERDLNVTMRLIAEYKESRKGWVSRRDLNKPQAAQAADIMIAESRLRGLNQQLDDTNLQIDSADKKYLLAQKTMTAEILANQTARGEAAEKIDPDAEASYADTELEIASGQGAKVDLANQLTSTMKIHGAARQEILQVEAMEAEIEEAERVKGLYLRNQSEWIYLKNACSKDGLRALEIEGVAPIITGYANDMLTGAFGSDYSIRFETQDPDGREILDIVVIGEGGSETLLSNLSGGERVWILKALRLAQTLISQQKSGRHFETTLMDEEDGALSNDNAMRFISLYGSLMEMAHMDSCYFISHRPDAINMADHRIEFKKGGVSII